MRCASESSRSLSASTQLRGRDNPRLDPLRLLPLDPHIRQKVGLRPNPLRPFLCRGIDQSPPLQPRNPFGTSSPSRPACDSAVLLPHPVPTAVLSPLCFSLFLSPPLCMDCECPSGCCVILQFRLFLLRLICPLLCFMPDDDTHRPHLYLIVSIHPSLWISSRVCVFLPSLPRCCVFGPILSCSRSYRMCILFFYL